MSKFDPIPSGLPVLAQAVADCGAIVRHACADGQDAPAHVLVHALRASGLLLTPLAEADGGADLASFGAWAALFEVLRGLGGHDLSAGRLFEGHVNAAMLVRQYGSASQRTGFDAALRDGALTGVWGADGAEPLLAQVVDGGVRLQGCKILASGAGHADAALVTARTEAGPLLILLDRLPAHRIDLSAWMPLGMTGTATGRVDLTGLTVPSERIIGQPGDFTRQPQLSGGAWRFCAAHLGGAERLLDLFRAHLVERGRATDPYQLQRVAAATVSVTTAAFWIRDAARRLAAQDADAGQTVAFANLTRTVTERAALDVIEAVERGVGLSALLKPHPAERLIRDLSTYLRQPVPDLAMADAARAVLASDRPIAGLWA